MLKKSINLTASILFAISVFFAILTISIALPIYFRPFYYLHITPLKLTASGFTCSQIIEAYNSVLNFLTLPNAPFSCGVMAFSESGFAHFADCKALINLNAIVLLCSLTVLIALSILKSRKKLAPFKLGNRSAAFYGAVTAVFLPTVIGLIASINFKAAFNTFHKIFFRNKSNWIFNPITDEIIKVLPEIFFRNCAILIGASIFIISAVIILKEFKKQES